MIDEKKLIEDIHKYFYRKAEDSDGQVYGEYRVVGEKERELYTMNKEICGIIKAQPTIEPYGTWIPVSSGKLPDVNREVWVVLKHTYEDDYQEYSVARYIDTGNNEHHWCANHYGYLEWDKYSDGRGGCSRYKVVAWMYIEPYREEKK